MLPLRCVRKMRRINFSGKYFYNEHCRFRSLFRDFMLILSEQSSNARNGIYTSSHFFQFLQKITISFLQNFISAKVKCNIFAQEKCPNCRLISTYRSVFFQIWLPRKLFPASPRDPGKYGWDAGRTRTISTKSNIICLKSMYFLVCSEYYSLK